MNNTITRKGAGLLAALLTALSLAGCAPKEDAAANRLEAILQRGYIEVATEPYFAPNEFIDPTKEGADKYVGSDIELAHYIADSLGVECHIVPLDFTTVLSGVTTGKYDLAISALAYTPERAEAMELSDGYYYDSSTVTYGLMVHTENLDAIQTVDDLAQRVIVVQSGSIQESLANEQIPAWAEMKRVSATTDGFLMVQEQKADAIVTAISTAQLYIDANPGCGMSIVPDLTFPVDEALQGTRIGLPKGETELLDKVNEIIAEVREQGLYDTWYIQYTDYAKTLGVQ